MAGTVKELQVPDAGAQRMFPEFTSPSLHLDTSFMYMIAGLCMLKLYQKRHPDINASAYSAYACLAIVIFFSVLGVVRPGPALLTPLGKGHACAHAHARPPPQEPSLLLPKVPSQPGCGNPASPKEGRAGGAAFLCASSALPSVA